MWKTLRGDRVECEGSGEKGNTNRNLRVGDWDVGKRHFRFQQHDRAVMLLKAEMKAEIQPKRC